MSQKGTQKGTQKGAEFRKHIEQAIAERRTELAKKLIPKYLAANRRKPEARLEASEFYRRLGEANAALNVLDFHSFAPLCRISIGLLEKRERHFDFSQRAFCVSSSCE